ncbi:MAG: hypothetical protein AAF408_20650, partial [Pseudomonadota bacterium]
MKNIRFGQSAISAIAASPLASSNLLASALILYSVQRLCARWFDEASGLAAMALIALWPNL